MISAISDEGVIGYPPKKRHPAAIDPYARASFPCQKATSGILIRLPYCDRHIRASIFTLTAPDAFVNVNRVCFHALVQNEHLFGANSNAQFASLAPACVYNNLKAARGHSQFLHFPIAEFEKNILSRDRKNSVFYISIQVFSGVFCQGSTFLYGINMVKKQAKKRIHFFPVSGAL
jgi:hypothetical protein